MLDKSKLIAQLHKVSDQLFIDTSGASFYAQKIWHIICNDKSFLYKVREITNPLLTLPLWEGDLGTIIPISHMKVPHIVLSVDGSQIYPDRHMNASCFLINTGSVVLPYFLPNKRVELYSTPTVFTTVNQEQIPYTTETVNCKRQELELQEGLALAQRIKKEYENTVSIILFDGSLIFWHLLSKEIDVRKTFLHAYCALLDELYQQKIMTAWYISSPKSKELINLVRLYMSDFNLENKELYEMINSVTDETLMHTFLSPYTRTVVFQHCSKISDYYISHIKPFFFYIHTGNEIGRVEIPAWIAHDENLVNCVAEIIVDQCIKGGGYPVALAEAHEQAVVKGPDRDFFYHFLQKMIIEKGKSMKISRKSLKKKNIYL